MQHTHQLTSPTICTYSVLMSQINFHTTPEFNMALADYMRIRGLKTKSEAIRQAVFDALEAATAGSDSCDFGSWLALAAGAKQNPEPRFSNHAELWED